MSTSALATALEYAPIIARTATTPSWRASAT